MPTGRQASPAILGAPRIWHFIIQSIAMIIIFHGDNEFITKRKLKEALENYSKKHKSGLNIFHFTKENFSFEKFKNAVETVSMFDEKKCLVLKELFFDGEHSDRLAGYLKDKKLKDDKDVILIFEEGKLPEKQSAEIKWLLEKPSLVYESKMFDANTLRKWMAEEAEKNGAKIAKEAIAKLSLFCKNDLWRLSNEIAKLSNYSKNISESDVAMLVSHEEMDSDIFRAIEFLAKKNKKEATEFFYKSRSEMAKKANMHPFVVQKSLESAKNYSLADLKNIYKKLLLADVKTKTSQTDPLVVLDEFVLNLR
ncbi:hypothetical protein HY249_00735 [Candidatus Azambacteria bacterium]|nr:hypothetical protein [Candidatus Azambacteria bacterium]